MRRKGSWHLGSHAASRHHCQESAKGGRSALKIILIIALTAVLQLSMALNAQSTVSVVVSISTQSMSVTDDKSGADYRWKVSTAKRGYRTPIGTFHPISMEKMHYSSLYENSPMPHSVFFHGNFAIHGTEYVKRLGKPASHGCVRLDPRNAKRLFEMIQQAGMTNVTIEITQ